MLLGAISPETLVIIIVVLAVIFGGSQLPKIAKNVGGAGREFKKAQREAAAEEEADRLRAEAAAASAVPPAVTAAPVPPVAPAPTVAAPAAAPNDNVTISRADLEALLDEKLKGQQSAN